MIERALIYLVAFVVVIAVLAAALPRVTLSLVALGVLALLARVVWFYTR
ncbi:MAG TPA: hypothetical protein VES65_10485 [Solirubrobacteraceae bacterium]|nr:hypothetical protein [Solirubrobacteraceae bacterium]